MSQIPTQSQFSPQAANTVKLSVKGIKKNYGQTTVLQAIDLDVRAGELLTLLGPSGSGKTTLLQIICGLVDPTAGSLFIDGRDETNLPVNQRDIGVVFQNYALFPHLTVKENIAFPLRMRKIAGAEVDKRVAEVLDMVNLGHAADRLPKALSGGQQQRAAIARSLVIEPELLLLDEPLSNLDAKLRDEMRDEIRDIQARTGVTAIFVTHDQDEALSMADRLAVMSAGRLEQIGTPREIFDRPQTEFVASFIGAGTVFEGKVTEHGLAMVEDLKELRFVGDAPLGSPVKLMIRPHRLRLLTDAGQPNRFSGTVEHIVYRGQTLTLNVRCGSRLLQADLPTHAGMLPERGSTVTLSVAPEDVTLVGQVSP